MTELKGKITVNGTVSFTCCSSQPNIYIDGESLHAFIKNLGDLTSPIEDDEGSTNETQYEWSIEYCTSDEPFEQESFEECRAEVVMDMLYSQQVHVCYSAWTCGRGDYDFLLKQHGHSILRELESFENEYVWLNFGERKVQ